MCANPSPCGSREPAPRGRADCYRRSPFSSTTRGARALGVCALLCLLWGPAALAAAGTTAFPRPPELETDIRFWTRVFTEVDTRAGFIHDNRRLDVVYETLRFDPEASEADQRDVARQAVERYRAALIALADGKRQNLTGDEERALALWAPEASDQTLSEAAERVRFQRGQADKFRAGYERSGLWRSHILETFRSMELPTELAALPHVESSYNPAARSYAGAAGLWQFTRPTGQLYLRINRTVDERLDPFKASEAAARLLKRNYELTGSWPLALTAYNHGAGGVMRAVRDMGTDDIVTIVRQYSGPAFGFASRNFYVSFLAALDVDRQAEAYFGPVRRLDPERAEALMVSRPVGTRTLARFEPPRSEGRKTAHRHHRVRRGETLSEIAARYGVSSRQLMAMNGLRSPSHVQAGQLLRLPAGES